VQPEKVLDSRIARGKRELLVRWVGAPAVEAAWVTLEEFREQFPAFQLEDELLQKEGRDVMYSRTFGRRGKDQGGPGGQN
jgi:hypothetical protein